MAQVCLPRLGPIVWAVTPSPLRSPGARRWFLPVGQLRASLASVRARSCQLRGARGLSGVLRGLPALPAGGGQDGEEE